MSDRLRAPLGFCATKGCPNRAHGHCAEHTKHNTQAKDAVRTRYDKRLHSTRWALYSRSYLARHPWCVGYPRDVHQPFGKLAECTDHILGTATHPELFWVDSNHQPLCHDCNRRKAIAEEGGFR